MRELYVNCDRVTHVLWPEVGLIEASFAPCAGPALCPCEALDVQAARDFPAPILGWFYASWEVGSPRGDARRKR
jgi:hypothetical protein